MPLLWDYPGIAQEKSCTSKLLKLFLLNFVIFLSLSWILVSLVEYLFFHSQDSVLGDKDIRCSFYEVPQVLAQYSVGVLLRTSVRDWLTRQNHPARVVHIVRDSSGDGEALAPVLLLSRGFVSTQDSTLRKKKTNYLSPWQRTFP